MTLSRVGLASHGNARRYQIFGLVVESEIELPELALTTGAGGADISVRIGAVTGDEGLVGTDQYLHRVPTVGAYRVDGGSSILIDPHPGVDQSHIRLFLLGTVMGIALHQRGVLPLHANGVEIDGRAVLFMGVSGAGKSTLASWLVRRGHRLLADDVCAITITDGQPWVAPGVPRFRLWEDAIFQQGLSLDGLALSFSGDPTYRKFDVPVESCERAKERLPLGGIYLLDRSVKASITRVSGLSAVQELYAHTYRGQYVALLGLPERHLSVCSVLAKEVPIFVAHREWGLSKMDRGNQRLLEHALDLLSGSKN